MARSSYIYVVIKSNETGIEPVAGFTVKHELLTWLGWQQPGSLPYLHVYRMPDNPNGYYAKVGKNGSRAVDITLDVIPDV